MAEPAIIDGNLIQDDRPLAVEQQGTQNQAVIAAAADVNEPAANVAAVVTYAPVVGVRHVITGIAWSYYGGVPVGRITVQDAGATVFVMEIADEGCGFIIFPVPKSTALVNTAMVITLAAAGVAGVTGKLSILNHWTEA